MKCKRKSRSGNLTLYCGGEQEWHQTLPYAKYFCIFAVVDLLWCEFFHINRNVSGPKDRKILVRYFFLDKRSLLTTMQFASFTVKKCF